MDSTDNAMNYYKAPYYKSRQAFNFFLNQFDTSGNVS